MEKYRLTVTLTGDRVHSEVVSRLRLRAALTQWMNNKDLESFHVRPAYEENTND